MKLFLLKFLFKVIILNLVFVSLAFAAITQQERDAMMDLYNATSGDNWTNAAGWKGSGVVDGSECTWFGVTCAGDLVTDLDLSSNNLTGSIPASISDLNNLNILYLNDNYLSGAIPTWIPNNLVGYTLFDNTCLYTLIEADYNFIVAEDPQWFNCPDPDPFTFTDQTGVELSAEVTSASITISGLPLFNGVSSETKIDIDNGTLLINGVDFGQSTNVYNGETITIKHTTSSSHSATVSTIVDIGSLRDTFSSTTYDEAAPPPPDKPLELSGSDVKQLTPFQVQGIDPETFKQGTEQEQADFFTNLSTNIKPADIEHLLPDNWSIDPQTNEIMAPPGTKITLPSLPTRSIDGVTLPDNIPDLRKSFSLGGNGGESFLFKANQSLKDAGLDNYSFIQDPYTGILIFTNPDIKSTISLIPDATSIRIATKDSLPLLVNKDGFVVLTTPDLQQITLRPAPHDLSLLRKLLNGNVHLGNQGDVLINRNNSVLTGIFDFNVNNGLSIMIP